MDAFEKQKVVHLRTFYYLLRVYHPDRKYEVLKMKVDAEEANQQTKSYEFVTMLDSIPVFRVSVPT